MVLCSTFYRFSRLPFRSVWKGTGDNLWLNQYDWSINNSMLTKQSFSATFSIVLIGSFRHGYKNVFLIQNWLCHHTVFSILSLGGNIGKSQYDIQTIKLLPKTNFWLHDLFYISNSFISNWTGFEKLLTLRRWTTPFGVQNSR